MRALIPLNNPRAISSTSLAHELSIAPHFKEVGPAIKCVIGCIHAIPGVLDADLSCVEVYIGRTATDATSLRLRWLDRRKAVGPRTSPHALVAFTGPTQIIKSANWEGWAQRIVKVLARRKGLCCANVRIGSQGRWKEKSDTALYVVVVVRPQAPKDMPSDQKIKNVASDLLQESSGLPDDVAGPAATAITRHHVEPLRLWAVHHRPANRSNVARKQNVSYAPRPAVASGITCKGCSRPALKGNYGFCDQHRGSVVAQRCKHCRRPALAGNYGFCLRHREVEVSVERCKLCDRAARPGNYGFCGLHR